MICGILLQLLRSWLFKLLVRVVNHFGRSATKITKTSNTPAAIRTSFLVGRHCGGPALERLDGSGRSSQFEPFQYR